MKILKGFTFNTRPSFASWRIPPIICVKHKVPYNIFQKWLKDIRKKIVEVQINGVPEIGHEEKSKTSDQSHPILQSKNDTPVRIWVDIRISNGLYLSQKDLSY